MGTAPINNPLTSLPGVQPARTTTAAPGTPADAQPTSAIRPRPAARDTAKTGRLEPLGGAQDVDLEGLHIPDPMLATGMTAVAGLVAFHDQVQGTVRKVWENSADLQSNLKKLQALRTGATNAPGSTGLTTSAKIFAGARVLRGLTSAADLPGAANKVIADIQHGDLKKAGLDGLRATGDVLGSASGVEAAFKLAGRPLTGLTVVRELPALGGKTFTAKIPVIGTAFAAVDFASKGIEMFRGVDSDGKPLSTTKKVSDVASMVGDAAMVVAMVTPPPIDAVAGVVAAGAALVQVAADHWDAVKGAAESVEHGVENAAHAVGDGLHALGHALHFL